MVRLSTTEFRGKVRLLHSTGKFKGIHNCKRLYETLVNQCGTARLKDELLATLDKLDEYESLRYPNINAPTEVGNDDWSAIEAFVEYVYRAMPRNY